MSVLDSAEAAPSTGPDPRPPADEVSRRFRGDIDGLRAIAIALVVAYHVDLPGVSGGFIGVDVFFVISGYLITRNLLVESKGTGRVALVSFWGRRIRRLVPAMSLMIITTLVASLFILPAIDMSTVARQGGAASLYISNLLFASELGDYFAGDVRSSPFLHTWSLGVEEQFYLVWPVVVGVVAAAVRRRADWLRPALATVFGVVLVGSFLLSLRLTSQMDPWAFYGLQSRAWEFAAAGLLAIVTVPRFFDQPLVRTASAAVGLVMIIATALLLSGETPYPGAWALLPVVGTVLVILAGSAEVDRPVLLVRGLASRPARWLGRVSYSWYLWHWPFIILAVALVDEGEAAEAKIAAGLISLGVATVVHHYVENPVRFNRRLARSWRSTFVMGAVLTVAALLVGVAVSGLADRNATPIDRLAQTALASKGSEICTGRPSTPSGVELCVSGDVDADRTVLVIGDSHARHWSATLDAIGKAEGIRIIGRWLGSCPPLDIQLKPSDSGQAAVDKCNEFRKDTMTVLDEVDPDAVLISQANFYEYRVVADDGSPMRLAERAPLWRDRFRSLLDDVAATGTPFGVIRDNPQLPSDPIECLGTAERVEDCSPSREDVLKNTATIRDAETEVLAGFPDAPQLSTLDTICDERRCNLSDDSGSYLRYYDSGHLTREFTDSQTPELTALLSSILAQAR